MRAKDPTGAQVDKALCAVPGGDHAVAVRIRGSLGAIAVGCGWNPDEAAFESHVLCWPSGERYSGAMMEQVTGDDLAECEEALVQSMLDIEEERREEAKAARGLAGEGV